MSETDGVKERQRTGERKNRIENVRERRKTRERKRKREKDRNNHKRQHIVKTVDNKNNTHPPTTRRLDVKQTEATTRLHKTEAFIVVRRPTARGGVIG